MDFKIFTRILPIVVPFIFFTCKTAKKEDTAGQPDINDTVYTVLYNGKNMDNWNIICRKEGRELPERVFTAGDKGEMHVFKDFKDGYGSVTNKNETHCMFFTKEKYSKFSFKFEYKWGTKKFNNFDQFQYDAGLYFHVYDVKIWPKGIEYQVRYNHLENRNHTGDIWNSGASFDWVADNSITDPKLRTYLPKVEGGQQQERRPNEHRAYKNAIYNGLNGKWNQCEVIVMGDKYAVFKLNGKVVNVLTNLSHKEGYIGLQAETAEIFYRDIKIKRIDEELPINTFLNQR
ncbi:DUF1080 domain-containing protein [uncultured Croceitalea sp.]|uniref:3-keto-disaccharide hydrolase n=1 Tax=uncultured Croceitalea sp. TaxID=1798908 RepID=UPI00374E8E59